ncbi:MAG TPA: hypothetical protein VF765_22385 [Polyangiaceae bacterium]
MSRRLVPAALLVPALFVAACSSASPTESERATSEAILRGCGAGTHPDCSGDGPQGQTICSCVQDSGCTFTAPAIPAWLQANYGSGIDYGVWVAAWAVPSSTATCPVITMPTGRWAPLGDPIGQFDINSTDGVPDSVGWWVGPNACSQVSGMGPYCCTYVWWPNGYPKVNPNGTGSPDDDDLPAQDTSSLCMVQGGHNVALEMFSQYCDAWRDGGSCPVPGSGGCGSCSVLQAP